MKGERGIVDAFVPPGNVKWLSKEVIKWLKGAKKKSFCLQKVNIFKMTKMEKTNRNGRERCKNKNLYDIA